MDPSLQVTRVTPDASDKPTDASPVTGPSEVATTPPKVATGPPRVSTTIESMPDEIIAEFFKHLPDYESVKNLQLAHKIFSNSYLNHNSSIVIDVLNPMAPTQSTLKLAFMAVDSKAIDTCSGVIVGRLITKYLKEKDFPPDQWDIRKMEKVRAMLDAARAIANVDALSEMLLVAGTKPTEAERERWVRALLMLEIARNLFHVSPKSKQPRFAPRHAAQMRRFWLSFSMGEICELRTARALLDAVQKIAIDRVETCGEDRCDYIYHPLRRYMEPHKAFACYVESVGLELMFRWLKFGHAGNYFHRRYHRMCWSLRRWAGVPDPIHILAFKVHIEEINKGLDDNHKLGFTRQGRLRLEKQATYGVELPTARHCDDPQSMSDVTWGWGPREWHRYFGVKFEETTHWLAYWQAHYTGATKNREAWLDILQSLDRDTIKMLKQVKPVKAAVVSPSPAADAASHDATNGSIASEDNESSDGGVSHLPAYSDDDEDEEPYYSDPYSGLDFGYSID
ncbi:hypothetical protein AAE478_002587 [Parahypoxylon ruwenzoriense]